MAAIRQPVPDPPQGLPSACLLAAAWDGADSRSRPPGRALATAGPYKPIPARPNRAHRRAGLKFLQHGSSRLAPPYSPDSGAVSSSASQRVKGRPAPTLGRRRQPGVSLISAPTTAAGRTVMPSVVHVTDQYANNRAEVSHQPGTPAFLQQPTCLTVSSSASQRVKGRPAPTLSRRRGPHRDAVRGPRH